MHIFERCAQSTNQMSTVCYIIREKDDKIEHFVNHSKDVDEFIRANYIEVEQYCVDYTSVFSLNKSWRAIQHGLYPKHNEHPKNPLSKVIIHSRKFEQSEMNASYLLSYEVSAIWEHLKTIPVEQMISNLDDADFYLEYDKNDVFWTKYHAIFNYAKLLTAYFIAQQQNNGLMFYYC